MTIHLPDGTRWAPDRLREVLGPPVQHPAQPELFAGVAVISDGLRCWIADVSARSVIVLAPVPAIFVGGETPLAWVGSSLAVPVEVPIESRDDVRQVFEAAPGRRIRLAPGAPPARRPSHVVVMDPSNGETRPAGLRPRPYQRVRGGPTGQVAACADATTVAICAPGSPDSSGEHVIQADGRVHEFAWLTTPRAAHLITLTEAPGGFSISSYIASKCVGEPVDLLYHHNGRYLHSQQQRSLFILTLSDDGVYSVIIVSPDTLRPSVRILKLPPKWPTILKIAAVHSAPEGHLEFATVDTENHVIIWDVPPEAATARRLHERTLPHDEELVTIAAWNRPAVRTVVQKRVINTPLPVHPGGPPPVHGEVADAAADFSLHLPESEDPAACLVWLSQRGELLPTGAAPGTLDPHWLTLAGFAVLDVRITPAWWPEVPDEEIRPRLVRQIRDAVTGSRIDRHVAPARLAVGGTSFGATLALLAIADCGLFSTAIVQSGAYARQLTPLGFQDETRTLWEAPRVYQDFDAVVNAPRIRKPVLIIHGEADQNPATPVAQATLLFQALIANGTRSRMVVLSGEGHTPLTRDGIAAALSEKATWLHSNCTTR